MILEGGDCIKIYAVEEHSGSYEDYRCYIEHIFIDKNKAEEYIAKSTLEWEKRVERSKMCEVCQLDDILEEVKNIDLFEEKGKKKCPYFELNTEDMCLECGDIIWGDDVPSYKIKEYEVE